MSGRICKIVVSEEDGQPGIWWAESYFPHGGKDAITIAPPQNRQDVIDAVNRRYLVWTADEKTEVVM